MERDSQSISSIKFVVDKVSFVNKLPSLNKATYDDARPTPGYLYQEIASISYERGSYCSDLLDYLVNRLEKASYHVKLKVLRLMRYIVDNGHREFRQGLRKNSHGIREAIKFGGPPDPLHGNAPYVMVRKEATELCRILFDVQDEADMDKPHEGRHVASVKLDGMGNGAQGTMQGFGNMPAREKSLTESLVGGLRDLAGKIVESSPPNSRTPRQDSKDRAFTSYKPVQFSGSETLPTEAETSTFDIEDKVGTTVTCIPSYNKHVSRKIHVQAHRPGVAGGGWEDSDEEDSATHPESSGESGSSRGKQVTSDMADVPRSSSPQVGRQPLLDRVSVPREEESSTEHQFVKDILTSTDHLLKRKEVNAFIKRCSVLNCTKVTEEIGKSLCKQPNNQHLHCLQLVEALLRTDLVSPDELVSLCSAGLKTLFENSDNQIQSKARKVIRILEKLCSDGSCISHIIPSSVQETGNLLEAGGSHQYVNTSSQSGIHVSNFAFIKAPFAPTTSDSGSNASKGQDKNNGSLEVHNDHDDSMPS